MINLKKNRGHKALKNESEKLKYNTLKVKYVNCIFLK